MSTNQKQVLEIQLVIPRNNYSVGEPIDATVILKNRSNNPVVINQRMGVNPTDMADGHWELKFDITYPPETPPFPGPLVNRGDPDSEDFTTLPSGGEITRTIEITGWHLMQFPGTYSIKAVYHNFVDGSQFGLSAWTGEITSDSVSLTVNE